MKKIPAFTIDMPLAVVLYAQKLYGSDTYHVGRFYDEDMSANRVSGGRLNDKQIIN